MKKIVFILFFFMISRITFPQDVNLTPNKTEKSGKIVQTIHSDVSTIAFVGFWSVNYEKTLIQHPGKNIIRFRTGFIYSFDSRSYGVPVGLTALFGKSNRRYFELTAGFVPRILDGSEKSGFGINGYLYYKYSIYPLIDLGYRFEPGPGKLFYRIKVGWTGLGVGVGYAF